MVPVLLKDLDSLSKIWVRKIKSQNLEINICTYSKALRVLKSKQKLKDLEQNTKVS